MLLRFFGLLLEDPALFFLLVGVVSVALLVAITVHEFGHALTANTLGDPTPRSMGRLTLNPIRHLDRFGTIMILLVGFGWGKPVPVNYHMLGRDPRRGMALVALAGAFFNILIASVAGLFVRLGVVGWQSPFYIPASNWTPDLGIAVLVSFIIFFNIILAVFNLIPIAPLDGFKVAVGLLPRRQAAGLAQLEQFGPIILIAFLFFGYYTGLLFDVLIRPAEALSRLLTGYSF
ncbi:MAG: site-2 protease family protein [Dehalococcoidia bacterium]|nr:site-2 protease family protein [Dehalococcoidia bacterium]